MFTSELLTLISKILGFFYLFFLNKDIFSSSLRSAENSTSCAFFFFVELLSVMPITNFKEKSLVVIFILF